MSKEKKAIKTSYFSILSNTLIAIIKGVAGVLGHSYALIADAIESTVDIFSSLLVLIGLRYAERPADKNHPYGHGRVEPIITFAIVGFLIVSATIITIESIRNILTPHELPKVWTLYILAVIILWKEGSYHYVMRRGKQTKSSSLKADAWHHRADAITSVTAFIGISLAIYFGEGYESIDDWAALFAAGIILYNSYRILKPALIEMMDEQVYDDLVAEIQKVAIEVRGIKNTEKCYVRKAGIRYNIDIHARVDKDITVEEGHAISHDLKDTLKKKIPELAEVLIHIEPYYPK